jgi:hypothetical protein
VRDDFVWLIDIKIFPWGKLDPINSSLVLNMVDTSGFVLDTAFLSSNDEAVNTLLWETVRVFLRDRLKKKCPPPFVY